MPRAPRQPGMLAQPANFSGVHKVWDAVHFEDYLALCAEMKPTSQFHRVKNHIKGICPFHEGDTTPSFMISPSKGIAKCFGGTCGKVFTNPIRLFSAMCGMSYGDAILMFRRRFGLKGILPESLVQHYQDYAIHQQYKKALCKALANYLVEAASNPDDEIYMTARPLVQWLTEVRHVDPSVLGLLNIGVIPPLLYLARILGGEETPEFHWAREYLTAVYEGNQWLGSLVFFMNDEPDNISRLKLRRPGSKDIRWIDDRYDEAQGRFRGFYGMHFYADLFGRGEDPDNPVAAARSVYLSEGEFDALIPIMHQTLSGKLDAIWIALGGKGGQINAFEGLGGLDRLLSLGVTEINFIPDRDQGGVGFVQHLLKQMPANAGVSVNIMIWPEFEGEEHLAPEERIKDPDQWIQAKGYDSFSAYVRNPTHFQQPHAWAFDQVADELQAIPEDDVRQKSNLVVDWGKFLRNPSECDAFCRRVAQQFNLDPMVLLREIHARDEDEDTFIQRIMSVIGDHFYFVGKESIEGHRWRMELWHKATRATAHMIINDERSVETALAGFFGSLPDFIRDYVGDYASYTRENEASTIGTRQLTKLYREFVNAAVLKCSKGLSDLRATPRKAQGLHFTGISDTEGFVAHMVNGRDVYKLTYPGAGLLKVDMLDGPRDRDTIFRVDPNRQWLHTVKSPTDILNGGAVDMRKLYSDVYEVLKLAWKWKHQKDPEFMALHVCCLPYMTVFSRQTAIMINGEHQSGKSRLTGGLIGGFEFPRIRLIAGSHVIEGYTPASIRQEMDGCSLVLCLSEFEDYGLSDKKTMVVHGVLELYRDMVSEGGVRVTLGTTSGIPRTYYLRHPLVCSAIRPLREAASLSRFITFELPKEGERKDPVLVMLDVLGQERINAMRHELAVGALAHLPALYQINREIEQEFSVAASLPGNIPSRFREGLHPALTMAKFLGLDYKQFAHDFCKERSEQLGRISSTTENELVFETVLSSPVKMRTEKEQISGMTTVRAQLARERSEIDEINMTRCGVYFDNDTGWLIVHWIEALQGVLSNSRYAREATPNYLKEVSERSQFHVPSELVTQQQVMSRIKHWTGPGISLAQVSVFDVRGLLEDAKNAIKPPEKGRKSENAEESADALDKNTERKVEGDDDAKL